jgi:hypothetical protein
MLQLDLLKFRQYLRSLLGGHCVQREGVVLLLCFASHFRLTVELCLLFHPAMPTGPDALYESVILHELARLSALYIRKFI